MVKDAELYALIEKKESRLLVLKTIQGIRECCGQLTCLHHYNGQAQCDRANCHNNSLKVEKVDLDTYSVKELMLLHYFLDEKPQGSGSPPKKIRRKSDEAASDE